MGAARVLMPVFQPPYADTVSPVYVEPDRVFPVEPVAQRLFRHMKARACGRTVLKIDGAYTTLDFPTQDQIDSATEVYLGGHVYTVSDAVGAALIAAGYTVT